MQSTTAPTTTRPLVSFLTSTTCGEPCWHAREEICRCECGGANHGCLRAENGEQPTRAAKIDGTRFTLAAVGDYPAMYAAAAAIGNEAYSSKLYGWMPKTPQFPAVCKAANASQIARYPELAKWRDMLPFELYANAPFLLWVCEPELERVRAQKQAA